MRKALDSITNSLNRNNIISTREKELKGGSD